MKTRSAYTPVPLLAAAARSLRLPSSWRAITTNTVAMVLVALAAVVVTFVAVGVLAFVLELARAMALAGPLGTAAMALSTLTGLLLHRSVGVRNSSPGR